MESKGSNSTLNSDDFDRRLTIVFVLVCAFNGIRAQSTNLIPNAGFEDRTRCDQLVDGRALPLPFAAPWFNPSRATPWLVHTCYSSTSIFYKAGVTAGHSGQGCAYLASGVDPDDPANDDKVSSQYASIALKEPLVAGRLYCFEAYLRVYLQAYLDPKTNTNVQGFGVYFSARPLASSSSKPFTVRPQLVNKKAYNTEWAPFRACFRATGGERYVTLGSFYEEVLTYKNSVVLVDDVSLTPVTDQVLGRDTSLCAGSSLQLRVDLPCAKAYTWSDNTAQPTLRVSKPGRYWVRVETECSVVTDSIWVGERRNDLDLGPDTTLCIGQSRVLQAPANASLIRWDDDSSNPARSVSKAGVYRVYTEQNGCPKRDEITLRDAALPVFTLATDTTHCTDGEPLLLRAGPSAYQYRWSDGVSTATRTASQEGLYEVEAKNDCGAAKAAIRVQLTDCNCETFWPTAFTPNGDGLNDLLIGYVDCAYRPIRALDWRVYDRWGEVIYRATTLQPGWNGRINGVLVSPGTYAYTLLITTDRRGEPYIERFVGSVLLLR